MSEVVCPRCQAEIDPAVGVCPKCGAASQQAGPTNEPSWRQQVRETVERRKELRNRQLEKRGEDGRQLSIFPEPSESEGGEEGDPVHQRRAEIRERVEKRLGKSHRRADLSDAGDVTIPFGPTASMAATAPELETPFTALDAPEPATEGDEESSDYSVARSAEVSAPDLASPGERVLAGLIDFGIVSLMLLTLLYLTSQVGGHSVRLLPNAALAALGVIGTLMTLGYYLFFWGLSGQTLGKLLTGSRVIREDGKPLGLKLAIARVIGFLLSALPLGAGFIGLWSDHQRRGWHDRLASSKVVRA